MKFAPKLARNTLIKGTCSSVILCSIFVCVCVFNIDWCCFCLLVFSSFLEGCFSSSMFYVMVALTRSSLP